MPTLVELVSLVAAVVATVTGVRVLRRRRTSPLALPLALMLFAASEWATARALLHVAEPSAPATVALHYAVFPGAAVVVPRRTTVRIDSSSAISQLTGTTASPMP